MKNNILIILVFLIVLVILSLAANIVMFVWLLRTRQVTLALIEETRASIAGISGETISYTVQVEHEIPVVASIPFYEEIEAPVNTVVPIDTTVSVPINAGLLGTYEIDVPIRTVIPVNIDVTVPISKTLNLVTSVPLRLALPVELQVADTPLAVHLGNLDAALARARMRLEQPLNLMDRGLVWRNP